MALFKGELSIQDILYDVPYRTICAIRDARVERLQKEKKAAENAVKEKTGADIRNAILRP